MGLAGCATVEEEEDPFGGVLSVESTGEEPDSDFPTAPQQAVKSEAPPPPRETPPAKKEEPPVTVAKQEAKPEQPAPEPQEPSAQAPTEAAVVEESPPKAIEGPEPVQTLAEKPEPPSSLREETGPPNESRLTRRRSSRDYSTPYYLQKRPLFALQLSGSSRAALGADSVIAGQALDGARGLETGLEVQPRWIQAVGVISLGLNAGYHRSSAADRLLVYGLRGAYQAKWFTNQWVVPVIGYSMGKVAYKLPSGSSGSIPSAGLFYGLRFFLSAADPDAAAEFYNGYDVSRVYLTLETTQRSGADSNLSLAGRSTSVGLRFEL